MSDANGNAAGTASGNGPVIDLADVEVRYGKHVALSQVSAVVQGGAIGLLGPNGAGKSSLIKALLGLVPFAKGKARVLGRPVSRRSGVLRRRIGYMQERDAAFPALTGFQATWYAGRLCGMPDADARRRAHEVLLFAGMEEARYRPVSTYSTGMRQRVKLAQALVHDPDLLFLDEPTNGLDPKGRTEMLGLIKSLSRDKGIHVVLSSHLLKDVEEVCNSVVVMRQGRVVQVGDVADLQAATEDALRVTVAGDLEPFRQACRGRGLEITAEKDRDLQLQLPDGAGPPEVFAAALEASVIVRRLVPMRVTLEDALIDVMGGREDAVDSAMNDGGAR